MKMKLIDKIMRSIGYRTQKEYVVAFNDASKYYNERNDLEVKLEITKDNLKESLHLVDSLCGDIKKYKPKEEECIVTKKFMTVYQNGKKRKALCHNLIQEPDEAQGEVIEAFRDTLFGSEYDTHVKNNLFNEAFKPVENYKSDLITYNKSEYWISTQEAIDIMNEVIIKKNKRTYDCEDVSILKHLLIPELKMHLCYVNGGLHMNNLLYNEEEKCFHIIESTCVPYRRMKARLQDQLYVEHVCMFDYDGESKITRKV